MAEPLNATFFAFRKREKSGVLTRAAIGFVIVAIVLLAGFFAAFWAQLGPIVSWYVQLLSNAAANDPTAIAGMNVPAGLGMMVLGGLLFTFVIFVLYASFEAACLRWMIHGEESGGFLGLALGAPTWRVYSGYWVWFGLYMAFSIVMGIVLMALMFASMGAMGAANSGDPSSILGVMGIWYLINYALMIYFGVRLAPAAASSIARRKFAFFDAWKITKGRFWALFGAFFLLFLLCMVFVVVLWVVMFSTILAPAIAGLGNVGADPQSIVTAEAQFMQAYFDALMQPSSWAVLGATQIVGLIVAMVFYLAWFGVNARAAQAALEEGKIAPAA